MRAGIVSAIFPDQQITDISKWTIDSGLGAIEVDYVRHGTDRAKVSIALSDLRNHGADIAALTVMGPLLSSNRDNTTLLSVRRAIADADHHRIANVVVFVGRNDHLSADAHQEAVLSSLVEICQLAAAHHIRILIENWPGHWKNYAATTPVEWRRLFTDPRLSNLGLAFDPSHLALQGIDPAQAITAFAERIFLVHGKDVALNRKRIQETGYFGDWWSYRLPGRGDLNWSEIIDCLKQISYDGVISIEHEDTDFGWQNGPLDLRKDGILQAYRALQKYL
jgi:sugar phosphate isomerase/epimerase